MAMNNDTIPIKSGVFRRVCGNLCWHSKANNDIDAFIEFQWRGKGMIVDVYVGHGCLYHLFYFVLSQYIQWLKQEPRGLM